MEGLAPLKNTRAERRLNKPEKKKDENLQIFFLPCLLYL